MRNNNSRLAFDQTWMVNVVLAASETNLTPVSLKSPTITEDSDLLLIGFHESPLLIKLIVPGRYGGLSSLESRDPLQAVLSAIMASQQPSP